MDDPFSYVESFLYAPFCIVVSVLVLKSPGRARFLPEYNVRLSESSGLKGQATSQLANYYFFDPENPEFGAVHESGRHYDYDDKEVAKNLDKAVAKALQQEKQKKEEEMKKKNEE